MKNNKKNTIIFSFLISASFLFSDPTIIQPGAPGEASKTLDPQAASNIADTSYINADVKFLQGMIIHHQQAILMSSMADKRTNNETIVDLAKRIDVSQEDEINFMESWLYDRGENKKDIPHHNMHMDMGMAGMATPKQLEDLKNTKATDFDRLFLQLMIAHHDGALTMVEELREFSGSAYDPILSEFVSDLVNDQGVEIERMNTIAVNLSDDPRSGLTPGLYIADEAIMNLELVASLKKPIGFFDPNNPEGKRPEDPGKEKDEDEEVSVLEASRSLLSPMLSFSNTDMAFQDDLLVTGSYHGFNMYKIKDDGIPDLISSVVCPGGQGDVSIVGDLLIMSVEQVRGRVDCGREGVGKDASPERFRGIRIFDISDQSRPKQVGIVQTCRGSHTHSVVSGPSADGKIIVYNSGTSSVRDEEELEQCVGDIPGDERTALFRIDIIEIPISDPSKSRIVSSPAVFADIETGSLAGLWRGGDHGDETQETKRTDQCHDITVFPSANIAAGACSGNGILFDITDPYNPKRLDVVTDEGFAYWHSATFNNDGTKIIFTDEWGGGGRARCRAWDPLNWGADAIYDIVDNKLEFRSHYKMPAPQLETENCVAHNGSIIPVPNRDIFVQAWYQGGISVIDFTDSSDPKEVAYFDRGPIDKDILVTGGYWSSYFYEGYIYGTEIVRGLDVFKLTPSQYLTENEIDAASKAYPESGSRIFNPQQQIPMSWPDNASE
ncbi:DUF305 domain-containing protein [Gammaproteobacteria bacterium]|nr:DUF305 domain-containing protein [Gammaproteobacteria bacterium]